MTSRLSDAEWLAKLRDQLEAIAPGRWSRVHDGDGCFVEAQGPMGELLPVLRFNPGASADEIDLVTNLPETLEFLLGLIDRAIRRMRQEQSGQAHPAQGARQAAVKNYAAECAIKCQDAAFKVFLEDRHGLERPLSDERVAQKVRTLLGVQSRRELNNGGAAGEAWTALRHDFDNWRRAGR